MAYVGAMSRRIAYRTCPFCEATCGLELHLEGCGATSSCSSAATATTCSRTASSARRAPRSPSSRPIPTGFGGRSCARGGVRARRGGRSTWDEAFALIQERLPAIIDEHGRDAVGVYVGNPTAHNLASLVHGRVLTQALGTTNVFTASTVDQMPKQVSAGLMFGARAVDPDPRRRPHRLPA